MTGYVKGYENLVHPAQCDVADPASVTAAVADALRTHGHIDSVINNAGHGLYGPIEELSDAEIAQVFDTNVTGPLRVTRAVLPSMREQGHGKIIMVSSLAAFTLGPLSGMYAASKGALELASEALRQEIWHWGIQVCLIEPGVYKSGFHASLVVAEKLSGGQSIYSEIVEKVKKLHLPMAASRPGPQTIASTMADAVEIEQPLPLRWPVGDDTHQLMAMRRMLTDAEWESELREERGGLRSAYATAVRELREG